MKNFVILFAFVVGCSPEVTVEPGECPADAGEGSSSSSSSDASCVSRRWTWGVNDQERFCDVCICPGAQCQNHLLGEDLVTGVCDENLDCSYPCTDENWIEPDAGQ
jgi:hypothetical protein